MVKKDIFWLNISVDDFSLMQVINGLEYLPIDLPLEFFIRAARIFLQELLQRLSIAILHLNVEYPYALLARAVNVFALTLGAIVALLVF